MPRILGKRARTIRLKQLRFPGCTACILNATTQRVCTGGRGNVMSLIMVVGEAPGEAEERTGEPFRGRSGELLDRLLAEHEMQGGVYITNAVKCRPPDNRKPFTYERERCSRLYLHEEIRALNPRVIVCLGDTATKAVLGRRKHVKHRAELPIKLQHHGLEQSVIFGRYIIPTWHPAYCLRWGGVAAVMDLSKSLALAREKAKNNFVDYRPV
jgi:uracil-DNA glycosylase family 4